MQGWSRLRFAQSQEMVCSTGVSATPGVKRSNSSFVIDEQCRPGQLLYVGRLQTGGTDMTGSRTFSPPQHTGGKIQITPSTPDSSVHTARFSTYGALK
jgi:hypothetical protein